VDQRQSGGYRSERRGRDAASRADSDSQLEPDANELAGIESRGIESRALDAVRGSKAYRVARCADGTSQDVLRRSFLEERMRSLTAGISESISTPINSAT
jgi:hypothetical protein